MTALFVIAESAYGQHALVGDSCEKTAMGGDALLSLTPICTPGVIGALPMWLLWKKSPRWEDGEKRNERSVGGNPAGYNYTASEWQALMFNRMGFWNTANGAEALVASGSKALITDKTGDNNTAAGRDELSANSTGISNIAEGFQGGIDLTAGSYNIDIGNPGLSGESGVIRTDTQVPTALQTSTNIDVIYTNTMVSGSPVAIDSSGQLGATFSFLGALQNLH